MKWLKIGDTFLNVDQVRRIDDGGSYLALTFTSHDDPALPMNLRLEGEAAEAMRQWINKRAKDLTPRQNRKQGHRDGNVSNRAGHDDLGLTG